MKVATVQMNSGDDVAANVKKACDYVARAASEGAELVLLPEFFNNIYFSQHWDQAYHALAESDSGPTISAIRESAIRHKIAVIATIYEEVELGLYYDTAMHVGADGAIRHKYRKVHPSAVKSLEKIYFRYGSRFDTYRFGDWRLGIGICYDMGFPETARCLAANGAELLIAPYATSRQHMFQEVLRTRAFENGCFLMAANKVGREHEWVFPGGSMIADPTGRLLASADTENEALLIADIDRAAVREARTSYPNRRDRRPDLYGAITRETDAG
jgi:N-carbamoylputrescine amidase